MAAPGRVAGAVLAALVLACVTVASPASAMRRPGALSPNLAELARPSVQDLSHAAQARRLGLAVEGPGSLVREGGRVLVEVGFDRGAIARLRALRAAGGRIVAASRRYQTVTVAAPPDALHELANVAGVGNVQEVRAPIVYGSGEGMTATVGAECEGGSVVSEGLDQLHVKDAWAKYGVDGAGVTVGVLSDSYDKAAHVADSETQPIATHAKEDVESDDLPGLANGCAEEKTPVEVLEDIPASQEKQATDEGRAMLQTVHDVAPAAKLAFATAFKGETSFAQNIVKLKEAGAEVIADDVAYFEEPFFQDGPVAAAVDKVASEGVSYFSAAGNDNLFEGGHEIASWEAPAFRDAGSCPAVVGSEEKHCMDFDPGAGKDDEFGMTVSAGQTLTVDLQWAEPWEGVKTDLDAFLVNGSGKLLASSGEDNVGTTQEPVEVLQWENSGSANAEVFLAVNRCFLECNPGANPLTTPRIKFALLENGSGVTKTEYPVSKEGDTVGPTIFGHTAAAGAVSVAAISFRADQEPESYSSRGPVKHFFGPVGPIQALPVPEEVIEKPDITATDCGATTFFAFFVSSEATWRFCGTSAATPHAAGVAALELQAEPAASPEEIRDAQASTAVPVGSYPSRAVGAGLLDADAAVGSLQPSTGTSVTITEHPENRTRDAKPTFRFTASPSPAEFTCSLAEGGTTGTAHPCVSPYETSEPLADGTYTFTVNAVDGGENVLGSASFEFTVDTTPPAISFSKMPGPFTSSVTQEFRFSASEPAGFRCALDGAVAKPCVSPFITPALAQGPHAFAVAAADQVGNEATPVEVKFTVDTTPPTVTFTERPREVTSETTATFGFEASETASFSCSFDGGPMRSCESPFRVRGPLADGAHSLQVGATDRAGNVGYASAPFTVDTKRPQTSFATRPHRVVRTRKRRVALAFRFHSNEADSNFICKVDRSLFHFCRPRIVRRFKAGRHVVEVKAQDATGNVDRTPAVYRFKVKRVR